MNAPEGSAAPESGSTAGIPTFEELAADPEIAALLDFEPVPRRQKKDGGWTPGMQRLFIARLAFHGSPGRACREIGKFRSGVDKLCESKCSASFRAAWERAVALAERRRIEHVAAGRASTVGPTMPFVDNRRKPRLAVLPLAEGQVLNERGEPEDEASLARRADEARDSISGKLRQARRLYLQEISVCPGKRAAFEILTELPIDWGKAQRLEPQADEPWRRPNLRQGDMLLTAENGWLGDFAHGPDKVAELRRAIDRYREEQGLERVQWDEDPLPSAGEGRERGQ
jgi:hypothetical protein